MSYRAVLLCLVFSVRLAVGAEPVERAPEGVARELLEVYGQKLTEVTYIPSLAVQGRWRMGELTGDAKYRDDVRRLIAPYVKSPPKSSGDGQFAAHVLFADIAADRNKSDSAELQAIVLRAVDQRLVTSPLPGDKAMSDAVFMVGPLLGEAYRLSGRDRYRQAAQEWFAAMVKLRMREDGLYQHGHLCDAAWGRGNGFPAVGVAWHLSRLGEDDAATKTAFTRHMAALVKHQDAEGMWHQVIDLPESYAEFSATSMIGFALERGITSGLLEKATYQPHADRAWQAICARIEPGGKLRGVCESTGTQPTLAAYLERKANHGIDARGGAMALLFATERLANEQ